VTKKQDNKQMVSYSILLHENLVQTTVLDLLPEDPNWGVMDEILVDSLPSVSGRPDYAVIPAPPKKEHKTMTKRLLSFMQHNCNEMHLYCRFRKVFSPKVAKALSIAVGVVVNPLIYKARKEGRK